MGLSITVLQRPRLDIYSTCFNFSSKTIEKIEMTVASSAYRLEPLVAKLKLPTLGS